MNLHYGDSAYWEVRYQDEQQNMMKGFQLFDWYVSFEEVYKILGTITDMKTIHKVLVIGVGRSDIVDVLYKKGYREITAIDISPTIVTAMQTKYKGYAGVEFFVMDARELHAFPDGSFSLVLDKGCCDSMFCSNGLYESVQQMAKEIFRVLKPEGGLFAIVTHAPASTRVPYLRCVSWAIDSCALAQSEELTLITMVRTTDQALLEARVAGAEARVSAFSNAEVILTQDLMRDRPTASSSKSGAGLLAGKISVTASVETLLKMFLADAGQAQQEDRELYHDDDD